MNPSTSFEDVYRVQTAAIERLEAENAAMRTALELFVSRDWTPDWIRTAARRALDHPHSNATTTGPRATSASAGK